MDLEKKTVLLLSEREGLKKKGNQLRLLALTMIGIILVSYLTDFYVIPISVVCIAVAFLSFFIVGLPTQKRLYLISKELRAISEES